MKRLLYSAVFWPFLGLTSALFFVGALAVFVATLPFDPNGRIQHLYSSFWAQFYFYCNPFWTLRIEHRERMPERTGLVVVSNHQSLGDILVLFGLYRPFKWVAKKSAFRLPFIGWNMRLNRYPSIVRGNPESAARLMEVCGRWIDRGVPVLFFPEGTRSPDGAVQRFRDGAFRLAIQKGCPILPIVITGTARTLPKHGLLLDLHADCVVRVLPPVAIAPFGEDIATLREHVRDLIVAEKARMDAGATS
ncbi:MAG: lysophospholipid acyltransferase family protein [Acidobacteriota bacterium]